MRTNEPVAWAYGTNLAQKSDSASLIKVSYAFSAALFTRRPARSLLTNRLASASHLRSQAGVAEAIGASPEGITGPELARLLYGEGVQATKTIHNVIRCLGGYAKEAGLDKALFFTRTPEGYAMRYRPGPILLGFSASKVT